LAPVYITVQTPDGREYDEMHVDGGSTSQMFFYPAGIDWDSVTKLLDARGTPQIYLIRNAYIRHITKLSNPEWRDLVGLREGTQKAESEVLLR
jgi:hypothetical protein